MTAAARSPSRRPSHGSPIRRAGPGRRRGSPARFLEGQDNLPVAGVSWYEAAAYAAFAGKSLPTIFHWSRAADQRQSGLVGPRSNFAGRGPIKVGSSGAMNRDGTFDLAGNVKEWCWNRSDESAALHPGRGLGEPVYMFDDADGRSPFERAANFGFRTVKYAHR